MIHSLLADLVILFHFGFILFAVLGGLLLLRWPRLVWLHLPAVFWAITIEFSGGVCPLTPLENWLRVEGGEAGYSGSFVQYYIAAVIYPGEISVTMRILLGLSLLIINLCLYAWVLRPRQK